LEERLETKNGGISTECFSESQEDRCRELYSRRHNKGILRAEVTPDHA